MNWADFCEEDVIIAARTLQRPGVNELIKNMLKTCWQKNKWVHWKHDKRRQEPERLSLSNATHRIREKGLGVRKAYPHTEVAVHSTGSRPGRWVWTDPLTCSLARSPPGTPPCGRSRRRCTSRSHAGAERGGGRSGLRGNMNAVRHCRSLLDAWVSGKKWKCWLNKANHLVINIVSDFSSSKSTCGNVQHYDHPQP